MIDLLELGSEVPPTDAEAVARAHAHTPVDAGRVAGLVEWLAGATGSWPPRPGKRIRAVVVGPVDDGFAALAAAADVGVRELLAPDSDAEAGYRAGVAAADDEVDRGADLVLLAGRDPSLAPAVTVSLLTGAEPVALLPRGAAAIDSATWIERAGRLRDARRSVARLRTAPADLVSALDSPALAAAAGFLMRAVTRRTPLLLEGTVAVAAALLCQEVQPRTAQWWRIADSSTDPAHSRAAEHLLQRPILDLGAGRGDGPSALLALAVLRTAVALTDSVATDG